MVPKNVRPTIRTKDISGGGCRYEVNVLIRIAGERYIYSQDGWELLSIFDLIIDKIMGILTKKRKKWKRNIRRFP